MYNYRYIIIEFKIEFYKQENLKQEFNKSFRKL